MVAVAVLATLLAVPVWLGQRCVWSRTPAGAGGRDRRTAQKTETLRSHRGRNSELRGPASEGQGDGHAGAAGRQTPGLETAEAQALRTRAPRGDVIASENERRRLSSSPPTRLRVSSQRDLERQRRALDAVIRKARSRFEKRTPEEEKRGVSVWDRSPDRPGPALCKPWPGRT